MECLMEFQMEYSTTVVQSTTVYQLGPGLHLLYTNLLLHGLERQYELHAHELEHDTEHERPDSST